MIRRTLKLAWYKRNRYMLTVVAIGLSVAFIVSTLLLTTSIADVGRPISDAYDGVDVAITGPEVAESDGPTAAVTAPVAESAIAALQAEGYEAQGFSNPYAQLIDADGNAAGQAQASANVAEPWLGDSRLNAFEITVGVAPDGPGQVVIDAATVDAAELAVGDDITYVTDRGLQEAELVGIASFGGAENDPYVSTILVDANDPIFESSQGFDYVLVGASDAAASSDPLAIVADVSAIVPDAEVQTGSAWVADQVDVINSQLGFFETFLTVFAIIAVVVGMVIVTNTFTVSLAQRTQELALLRLVGTTRRQLMGQVVIEAFLLGLVGTAIGVVAGFIGLDAMGALLDFLGLSIERSDAIAPSAIIIGALVGIGVTIGAAVWPARKATDVAPIEALRSAELEPPSASRRRVVAAAVSAVVGVGFLAAGMTQGDATFAGIGIGGLFLALYLGGEFLIKVVARLAKPILAKAGPTGTVASRNLERNAGRTTAAASALMIGVSLIGFFTLMAATIGQFVAGDSADALTADYVVQGVGMTPEPIIGEQVLADLESTEGVDAVVPIYQTVVTPLAEAEIERVGPGDGSLVVALVDLDALASVYELDVTAGAVDGAGDDRVVIDQATADAYLVDVGDPLAVTTRAGQVELEVAAIVSSSLPGTPPPAVIGEVGLGDSLGAPDQATTVYLDADADEGVLTDAVGLPTVDVLSNDDYIDSLSASLDTILALVYALLAVALVIALVGIANTVSLAISERVAEIAAIRAAGASMRQIFWSLIAEFGLLALVGVFSGLALAWVSATGFFQALSDGQISYPETDLFVGLLIVVAGLVGGALAAWIPSRHAARSDILDVLRAE